jgi:hypothetical protein
MTPAQRVGLKVGDKIKVTRYHREFVCGEVIELIRDDGDDCPLFSGCSCESYFDISDEWGKNGWQRVEQETNMNKQQALAQIDEMKAKLKELESYVKEVDNQPVMVYIKKWKEQPSNWNHAGYMDYLCGTIQEIYNRRKTGSYRMVGNEWSIRKEDFIVLEGDISKFN